MSSQYAGYPTSGSFTVVSDLGDRFGWYFTWFASASSYGEER